MTDTLNLRQVDVAALARDGRSQSGQVPLALMPRLLQTLHHPAPDAAPATWQIRGEQRLPTGGAAQIWLHLALRAVLPLQCQRCMEPLAEHIDLARSFRFVADEAAAAHLDAQVQEDVLAISRHFNLLELMEDELLMALPLVPRHTRCPRPVTLHTQDAAFDAALTQTAKPLAGLAQLTVKKVKNS